MRAFLLSMLVVSLAVGSGCGPSETAPVDAGSIDGSTADGGTMPDASSDGGIDGGGGCVEATVSDWALVTIDGTMSVYRARIAPQVSGRPFDLYIEARTYNETPLVGEFTLGSGIEGNYGDCARCVVAFYGTSLDRGYFARSGTLTIREEPVLTLDAVLDDVELEEVTIEGEDLRSVPVPGGGCIHIEHAEVQRTFSPPGWECDPALFHDGETCDCECGIVDWDCFDRALPIAGCEEGQLCMPTGGALVGPYSGSSVCVNDCERDTGDRCPGTEVCVEHPYGDLCIADPVEIDRVAQLGGTCRDSLTLYCAIDASGSNQGFCDHFVQGDRRCRPRCRTDADCDTAADERCYVFNSDQSGETEVPIGYCAVPYPQAWTCGVDAWDDGTTCHCGCGEQDPDCLTGRDDVPIAGCEAGQICRLAECTAP